MPRPPPRRPALALLAATLLAATGALAQPGPEPGQAEAARLELWNRPILMLRKTVGARTPAERATAIAERITALPDAVLRSEVTTAPFESAHGEGLEVELAGTPVLRIYREDLDPDSGETLEQVSAEAVARLQRALLARQRQHDAARLARGVALSLLATALFALLTTLLVRSRRFLTARIFVASEAPLKRASRLGVDLRRSALLAAKYAVDALALGLGLLVAYLWLTFVFVQFPYSEPWGDQLGLYLIDLAVFIGSGMLHAVPDLLTVVAILLVTRALSGLVTQFFGSIQRGRLQLAWLEAETAEATRRIVVAAIWVFALTAAFPFIPGSDSVAFRGIGVLAGVMVSLGSAGFVNQAMSGLVVVYSRAFREGDYVKIGDVEGTVVRRGSLTTKIRNVRNEEVTVPNGVVITSPTVNYTRLAGGSGALVSTTLTIGYDVPWRQVHALLEQAAHATEGLRRAPPPTVVQRALSDWYVEYQLVACAERSEERAHVLSRLHAAIQDAFNEHGVQIMSPHFALQPGQPVVVPPERWSPAPARPEAVEPRKAG